MKKDKKPKKHPVTEEEFGDDGHKHKIIVCPHCKGKFTTTTEKHYHELGGCELVRPRYDQYKYNEISRRYR